MTKAEDPTIPNGSPDEFHTRQFSMGDLQEVITINRICLPENYPRSFFTHVYSSAPEAFRVATVGTKVVGYVMARLEDSVNIFKRGRKKKGHIISVAVLPQYRRKGLAKRMLIECLEVLEKINAVECYLEVRESNSSAISLYEQLDFVKARVIPRYYKDGESALVLTKSLI
ncbi:MAG: GNAT family N-acetyltransferase [Promethearchaeota archaeon]